MHLGDGNGGAVEIQDLSIGGDVEVGVLDPDGEVTVLGDVNEAVILGLVVELLERPDESGIDYGSNWLW